MGQGCQFNIDIDVATGVRNITGTGYNATVPNYGIVYFDAGPGIFEEDGTELKFSGIYLADDAVVCAAMDQLAPDWLAEI